MTGEAVGGNHAYPAIDVVLLTGAAPLREITAQSQNFIQRVAMKKHRQVDVGRDARGKLQLAQPFVDVADAWGLETRARQDLGERINVVRNDPPAAQRCFNRRRAASTERVIYRVAFLRK